MDTERMVAELWREADKHRNDRLFAGQTNITAMCEDVIPKLQELKWVENLRERGVLIELPCKLGATVYVPHRGSIQEMTITGVYIDRNGYVFYLWEVKDGNGICPWLSGFSNHHIGKTVFLAKESAEAALREMENQK